MKSDSSNEDQPNIVSLFKLTHKDLYYKGPTWNVKLRTVLTNMDCLTIANGTRLYPTIPNNIPPTEFPAEPLYPVAIPPDLVPIRADINLHISEKKLWFDQCKELKEDRRRWRLENNAGCKFILSNIDDILQNRCIANASNLPLLYTQITEMSANPSIAEIQLIDDA